MKRRTLFLSVSVLLSVATLSFSGRCTAATPEAGEIDVWDFGAEQLDASIYNNHLTVDVINSWYAKSIAVGSSGNVLPGSWTAGVLGWVGGSNDRLRTTNRSLTRYDENLGGASGYTGRLYVNSAAATG